MKTSLVLLALACGLAVCAAQLMNAAVTSTATAVSTATTATVTFTSTKGQAASATNAVNLPCFSQACTCNPSTGLPALATPQVVYSTPSASCPAAGAAGTPSGTAGTSDFAVSNANGPALLAAAPAFTVTASTTSANNALTVDSAGAGATPQALGGKKVAVQAMSSPAAGSADLRSGAVTAGTLVFNFVTTVAVPQNGQVIINLPYNYLATQSLTTSTTGFTSCGVMNTAANANNCGGGNTLSPIVASGKITCTAGAGGIAAGTIALTFAAGWKSGDPTITNVASGYTVQTTTSGGSNIEGPADSGATLTAFTSQTLTTAPTLAAATPGDLDAQTATTTGTLTLVFKTVNAVPALGAFVLTTPVGYFRVLAFTSSSGTTGGSATASCAKTTPTTTNDVWTCTTVGSNSAMPAATSITWISAGGSWSVLNNQATGAFSVSTATAYTSNPVFVIDAAVSSAAGAGAPAIVGAPGAMQVAAMALSASTDSNPGLAKSTGTLTFSGILPAVNLTAAKSFLVFTFPYKYITATAAPYTITGVSTAASGVCDTFDTAPGVACSPATPTAGYTTMTCTIANGPIPTASPASNLVLTANGAGNNYWRIASNTASGSFTVQAFASVTGSGSSTVISGVISAVSSGVAVPATGSTVTSVAAATNSVTAVPGDKLPGITTTGTLTLGVTPASPLSVGSTIVFTLPANYLIKTSGTTFAGVTISTSTATVTCTMNQATANGCGVMGTTSTISCVTGGAVIPSTAVASVTFAAGSWSLAKGATGTYTATTYNDLGLLVDKTSGSAALITATASGAVSNVQAAVFSKSTDQVPGLATTTGTLTFTFTTATTIPSGSIAIVFQSTQYLATAGAFTTTMGSPSAAGPTGTCSLSSQSAQCASSASVANCGVSSAAVAATQTLTCSFSAPLTAGVVTLILTAGTYTVGSSQAASKYTVSTSTAVSIDAAGTTTGNLPALAAGAVSAVSTAAFSVPGDMVPGTTSTGTLTFGFTTATDLAVNAIVVISLPVGYLNTVTTAKLGANACSNLLLGSGTMGTCPGTTYQKLTCTVGTAAPKGVQSLVLQTGFVVGPKNAGTTYMAWTTTSGGAIIDTPASGSVPAITVGGTASGSGTAAASVAADLVPGATANAAGTLTLAFTTQTKVPMTSGKIVFSLTQGWFNSAAAATLTGGSPATTSTCSMAFSPGTAASGCNAAVAAIYTCTVGTADLAAGTYNLVLTAGQWSVGSAQPAGTFSVSTNNNNVVLDAASTTTGVLPKIGSTVAVTSFAATTSTDAQNIGVATSGATTGTFTIGFTTTNVLVANSFIVFTLPAANYFSVITTATISGGSTTAPTCSLITSNTQLKCVFNSGGLTAGASVITLAAGWTPGATVQSSQFPTIANFNKATYTISNLISPAKYLPATTYSSANIQASFSASGSNTECSAALAFQQFGTAPPSPGPNTPGASSGKALALSAVLALSSIMLFLF